MGIQIYPTVPVAREAAESWPADQFTIRADEMFARRLDTEFASGVHDLLHNPKTGLSSLSGEAALEAIAGVYPTLEELRQRTLDGAVGPRQRALLEPSINTPWTGPPARSVGWPSVRPCRSTMRAWPSGSQALGRTRR